MYVQYSSPTPDVKYALFTQRVEFFHSFRFLSFFSLFFFFYVASAQLQKPTIRLTVVRERWGKTIIFCQQPGHSFLFPSVLFRLAVTSDVNGETDSADLCFDELGFAIASMNVLVVDWVLGNCLLSGNETGDRWGVFFSFS